MEQDALSGEQVIPQDHGSMLYLFLRLKWHISEEGKKDIIFYLFLKFYYVKGKKKEVGWCKRG